MKGLYRIIFAWTLLGLLLFSCSDRVAGGNSGSEVPNAIALVLPDGSPAAHARVRLSNPNTFTDSFTDTSWLTTNEQGKLELDSLPYPTTRIEARSDSLSVSFLLTQSITERTETLDTLKPSGKMLADIFLPLQSQSPGFWVQFKGILHQTYCAQHSCAVQIENLPAGSWEYRILPKDSSLQVQETSISLNPGDISPIDSLKIQYSSAPLRILQSDTLFIDAASLLTGYPDTLRLYPLLIQWDQTFNWTGFSPDGSDIRFLDSAGNPLSFQTELFDPYLGHATFWVQIPMISANMGSLKVVLQRGVPNGQSIQSSPFDSKFFQAWHLGEPLGQLRESAMTTGNSCSVDSAGNHTQGAGLSSAQGIAGYALRTLAGDGWLNCGEINAGDTLTLSAWVKSDSVIPWARVIYRRAANFTDSTHFEYSIHITDSDYIAADYLVQARNLTTWGPAPISLETWYHVASRFNGSELTLFINGDSIRTMPGAPPHMAGVGPTSLVGDSNSLGTQRLVGMLDEVRFSSNARSSAWIAADYRSQVPGNTIVSW